MKLQSLYLLLLIPLVAVIALVAREHDWRAAKVELVEIQHQIDVQNRDIYKIPMLKRDLDGLASEFEEHAQFVHSEEGVASAIGQIIEQAAPELSHVKIVEVQRTPTEASLTLVTLRIRATGPVLQLLRAVAALEDAYCLVQTLSGNPTATPGVESIDFTVEVHVGTPTVELAGSTYTLRPAPGLPR